MEDDTVWDCPGFENQGVCSHIGVRFLRLPLLLIYALWLDSYDLVVNLMGKALAGVDG